MYSLLGKLLMQMNWAFIVGGSSKSKEYEELALKAKFARKEQF